MDNHKITQLDFSDWNEIFCGFHICILNYYYQDLVDKYGIQFFQYSEEGLGKQLGSVISIDENIFFLNCYFDENVFCRIKNDSSYNNENREALKISVYVRSFEYDSKQAFNCLYQGLDLSNDDIYYVRPDLGIARFCVYKQSNQLKKLINRFQTELDAKALLRFEKTKRNKANELFFIEETIE
jgi:hypothetical protein